MVELPRAVVLQHGKAIHHIAVLVDAETGHQVKRSIRRLYAEHGAIKESVVRYRGISKYLGTLVHEGVIKSGEHD